MSQETSISSPIYPRRPILYATLMDIIDTEHAEAAMVEIRRYVPGKDWGVVEGIVREVCRRGYVDGLRDGFVQGVAEESRLTDGDSDE